MIRNANLLLAEKGAKQRLYSSNYMQSHRPNRRSVHGEYTIFRSFAHGHRPHRTYISTHILTCVPAIAHRT